MALEQIAGVDRAVVCDVTIDGELRLGAAVAGTNLSLADLAKAMRSSLSTFKVPRLWLLLEPGEDFPRLVSGKVDVPAVRNLIVEKGEPV